MKILDYWPLLRVPLISWLVVLCLMAGVLVTIIHRQSLAESALAQARHQRQQQQQSAAFQASYQPDIQYFLTHRASWQKFGLLRPPDFGHWDASLIAIQQQSVLPHVAYEVMPSKSCTATSCRLQWSAGLSTSFQFTATPIKLHWSVTHESVVMDWLQQLEHAYGGMLLVHHCGWILTEDAHEINAQCDLELFNFPHALPTLLMSLQP